MRLSHLPVLLTCLMSSLTATAEDLTLQLQYQQETSLDSGRFHQLTREEQWKPEETAIIVCDVWDYHHCLNAVRRLEEFVPRLDEVLKQARAQGVTIIHSPSDCMPAYAEHPARKRTLAVPAAGFQPYDAKAWCSVIPAEERAVYPIDQSDGGEDDDPAEHAEWAAKLKALGRNPGMPWKKQTDMLTIDGDRDYISDRGDEVWNVLQQQGIRNVILTGVHTNMCVLGRPFGLRQMARAGKNVVLMRDMTDTMYNPQRWPFVSHFTGTDLVIAHIEKFVCPTITSDQILGGKPFRFSKDTRPHVVMLIAEDEYRTNESLPQFAVSHLGREFRVTMVFGDARVRNSLPGIDKVRDADVLFVSIRRRVLPEAHLKLIRDHVSAGKPVIGIRTASHAFSLRGKEPPEGFDDWPEFDAQVFGGNYTGHHGNKLKSVVSLTNPGHPIAQGITPEPVAQGWSLYKTSPLNPRATVLTVGRAEGHPEEPVSWVFEREDGGRSFYSSMGHVDDFKNPAFTRLLYQGICWAAQTAPSSAPGTSYWESVSVPMTSAKALKSDQQTVWYRCAFRVPAEWSGASVSLHATPGNPVESWVNGTPTTVSGSDAVWQISADSIKQDDANLLVLRMPAKHQNVVYDAPRIVLTRGDERATIPLAGQWQRRAGADDSFANIPLPAKFGAGADVVFSLPEPLWTARPVTRPGEFTPGIEGPACDHHGNIFAVNFQKQGTIGRVSPNGSGEIFVELPEGSVGNGIRFDREGNFYVADYPKHNILKVNPATRKITKLAHHEEMNQPNDLAIAPDGTLYASDPAWAKSTGQLWRIDQDGTVTRLATNMGTTNGIEVSPDGKKLYVNESVQRNVWSFDITSAKTLVNKRLIRRFPDHGFDGMRCDVDGNLYITRYGEGTVVKMTPQGKILKKINVLGGKPSNLCFGGPDGCTVYVTEVEGTRLVSFRVDRPGRSWAEQARGK